ncbi:carbon-nitrogen hydrolase family protein [Virgibacillus sp. DJP39]|uniref:carbon-nitrogen hydrolase family protein n=1 Tax=Virgibacillus sp. DJP39 TaxID=3409790 RepID=UPI003BB78704
MNKLMGIIQASFAYGEVEQNLKRIEQEIVKLKTTKPDLAIIVLPELAVHGYGIQQSYKTIAEHAEGDHFDFLSNLAKKYNLYIVYGFAETANSETQVFNSANLISPNGKRLFTHRKIQLTEGERVLFQPGNELGVVSTELGRVGMLICWDLAFPDVTSELAKEKPTLLLAPSAWENPYSEPFHKFAAARALDYTMFVAAVNHVGTSGDLEFFGQSAVYSPDGSTLHQLPDQDVSSEIIKWDDSFRIQCEAEFYTMNKERKKNPPLSRRSMKYNN